MSIFGVAGAIRGFGGSIKPPACLLVEISLYARLLPDYSSLYVLTNAILTGYVGGTVLTRFLAHPHADTFQFTVLVRDPKKAEKFRDLGIKAVVGSHSDAKLVEKLASEADVVIAMANCDDLGAAKATLEGLRRRHASGAIPIFINTSGTGVISDDTKGMHSDITIYDDSDANQIKTIAPTNLGCPREHLLYDVGKEIGTALVALKRSDSAEPTTFTQADLDKYFGGDPYLGSNSRCRATRSLSIGWKPTKSTSDMLASIRPEMEALIKKNAGSAP
ncbi:hypothetical protein B0H19DRAFT_1255111 [Mycena capillaripes]|nr:hypothetical protein B0H19DRAFT_1255111 [Mycena capillaripes]